MNKEVKKKIETNNELINKLFVEFLKSKRLYSKFARELREDSGKTVSAYLKQFLGSNYDQYMYLSGAFYWVRSKDGNEFWSNVNKDWLDFAIEKIYE